MKKFANLKIFTDIEPWEVIRVISEKTIVIRRMRFKPDHTNSIEFDVGGFSAHAVNSHSQRWIIESDANEVETRARLHNDGYFHSEFGKHLMSDKPIRYYDFNF